MSDSGFSEPTPLPASNLRARVGLLQFFNLAFGSIMGIAWLVMIGTWLGVAGPVGAIVGFVVGGVLMLLIGLCYAELATALPVAGGEVIYAHEVSGPRLSFAVGWYLALVYIAVCAFEAISLAWILEVLVPGIQGPTLYTIMGAEVTAGGVIIAFVFTALLAVLNCRGLGVAAKFQDALTYTLFMAAAIFWIASFANGHIDNAKPLFRMDGENIVWSGILWVCVTTPMWLSGFQVIPQVIEERAPGVSTKLIGKVIVLAIAMAIVFYVLVIASSAIVVPWMTLLESELPVVAALDAAFGSGLLTEMVLLAGVVGILTTWNALLMVASRLLLSLGRARMLPLLVARVYTQYGSPAVAILIVSACGALGALLGRNILVPIVNIGASCLSFAFVISCWGVLKLRREQPLLDRPYRVPGGRSIPVLALAVSLLIFAYSIYEPFASTTRRVPVEWLILLTWGAAGVGFWIGMSRLRASLSPEERRRMMIGDGGRQ